jgi:restriction endonuclease S subunit
MKAEFNAKTQRRKDARDVGGLASLRPGDLALSEGFRDTPLGPLPETWEVVQFEDAIRYQPARVGKVKQQDYMPTGRFPIIDQSQSLVAGYWDDPLDAYQGELPVVVFGDHTRVFKFVDFPFVCGADGTRVLLPGTKFDPSYFFFALSSIDIPSRGYNRHYSVLKQKLLPCPPQHEQLAIAHVLRTVQEAREATERVIATARELKRSLMHHLFTYSPVPVAQTDRLELQETPFGSAPAHWRIAPLDKYAFVQTGAAKGRKFGDSSTITVPYLRVANVQDGYLNLSEIKYIEVREDELRRYSLQPGDVVVTEGGDFDKLGRGFIWHGEIQDCIHQNHIFAIRAERSTLLPEYLTYLIQSGYGKSYFLNVAHRTTHLACINTTKLRAFPTLIPSLAEQREIADILSTVDAKIAAEEARRGALEALFHTMLHHLMTGKIRTQIRTQGRKVARMQRGT